MQLEPKWITCRSAARAMSKPVKSAGMVPCPWLSANKMLYSASLRKLRLMDMLFGCNMETWLTLRWIQKKCVAYSLKCCSSQGNRPLSEHLRGVTSQDLSRTVSGSAKEIRTYWYGRSSGSSLVKAEVRLEYIAWMFERLNVGPGSMPFKVTFISIQSEISPQHGPLPFRDFKFEYWQCDDPRTTSLNFKITGTLA